MGLIVSTAEIEILDTFCCQGGVSEGLHRAFPSAKITGVDKDAQPRYPFNFIQADAIEYIAAHGHKYDFIWSSPPCQAYTWGTAGYGEHPDLVDPTRIVLRSTKRPYIIENVVGAPLYWTVELCGTMFPLHQLRVFRHRRFEASFTIRTPIHPTHTQSIGFGPEDFVTVAGHGGNGSSKLANWKSAMGIDWMDKRGLSQAIPPAYSEYLARFIPLK